jgi:hypothetical protein
MGTLLIFLFIFGLFGWSIWRLLHLTRDTVGENSPLKVQRVYQVSKRRCFLGFYGIMGFVSIVQGIAFLFVITRIPPSTDIIHPVFLYFLVFLIVAGLMGLGILSFALLLNHWPYAKGVSTTTNPSDHSLQITLRDRVLTLREGGIERIEAVVHKARIGFYRIYYLTNGDRFLLAESVRWDIIDEYFPKTPFSGTYSYFGFIKKGLLA